MGFSPLWCTVLFALLTLKFVSTCMSGECRQLAFPLFFFFADKRLMNHNIASVNVPDMDVCELLCYQEPNCVSVNFENKPSSEGTYRCELNNATHREHDEEFENTKGFFYHGANSACDTAHCNNGGTCQSGFTDKGYRCLCPPGFTSENCENDINECKALPRKCGKNAKCKNTIGSYTCLCKSGYSGNSNNCHDIDECASGTHNCSDDAMCYNTNGAFKCTCKTGYSGDGHNCTDIDECATGTHNCSSDAVCNNTKGAFSCRCKQGHTGDGHKCTATNFCTEKQPPCQNGGTCDNTDNGYICRCALGFAGMNCEHKFSMPSTILQDNESYHSHLHRFLSPAVGRNSHWLLCYRASEDGWEASSFHGNCDGKENTVTIIKKDAYVFGGYSDIPWEEASLLNRYGSTSKAFLFSLSNKEGMGPFKSMVQGSSRAIYRRSGHGPTFGGRISVDGISRRHDIHIANEANISAHSYTHFGHSYSIPSGVQDRFTILAGSYNFSPDEVEVFYLDWATTTT